MKRVIFIIFLLFLFCTVEAQVPNSVFNYSFLGQKGWTVISSSVSQSNIASNVIDGDSTTFWSTQPNAVEDSIWLQVDMGISSAFNGVYINQSNQSNDKVSVRKLTIYTSSNGADWNSQGDYYPRRYKIQSDKQLFSFAAQVTARYYKIVVKTNYNIYDGGTDKTTTIAETGIFTQTLKKFSSAQPYNLNVIYVVPTDAKLDPNYRKRLSQLLFWGQNYYKQNMISNGYGSRSFGLLTESDNPDSVQINVISGVDSIMHYDGSSMDELVKAVHTYYANNPSLQTSDHFLILNAGSDANHIKSPFVGSGHYAFAVDWPDMDIKYLGMTGSSAANDFATYYGGLLHELGHGLTMPHSCQTKTERNDLNKGVNLMSDGNYGFGQAPRFINRAGCALLSNCQVFQPATTTNTFYNGHTSWLASLHTSYSNGNFIVSGTFRSNREVTDVNFYQRKSPDTDDYFSVAWSTPPTGTDSFYVSMPINELENGNYIENKDYTLIIELALKNGERQDFSYSFKYVNNLPITTFDFDAPTCNGTLPLEWYSTFIGTADFPSFVCYDSNISNFQIQDYNSGSPANNFTYVYTQITGNATIVARIKNLTDTYNNFSGIMIRKSLAVNSAYWATGALDNRGVFNSYRNSDGANSGYQGVISQSEPIWIKIERNNDILKSYYSSDGINWDNAYTNSTKLGTGSYYIGLAVSGSLVQTNIDNVSIEVPSGTLSVGLTGFVAQKIGNAVQLSWNTTSEINNDHFEVERSADGKLFNAIEQIAGHGTTNISQQYSLTDHYPLSGVNYYRLKQVDCNGLFVYSNIVKVLIHSHIGSIAIAPNPVVSNAIISLQSLPTKAGYIRGYDVTGKKVLQVATVVGNSQVEIDFKNLPSGIYYLEYHGEKISVLKR